MDYIDILNEVDSSVREYNSFENFEFKDINIKNHSQNGSLIRSGGSSSYYGDNIVRRANSLNKVTLSKNSICVNSKTLEQNNIDTSKNKVLVKQGEKSLLAEEKLIKFIDQILDNLHLEPKNLALVGFSQGCMISIQVGLKNKKQVSCIIGYSGKIINQKNLSENINSKPKILLMHGENDAIVSPTYLLESKEYLVNQGIKVKTKLFKNCEHSIPVEGTSLGLEFLRKNLL